MTRCRASRECDSASSRPRKRALLRTRPHYLVASIVLAHIREACAQEEPCASCLSPSLSLPLVPPLSLSLCLSLPLSVSLGASYARFILTVSVFLSLFLSHSISHFPPISFFPCASCPRVILTVSLCLSVCPSLYLFSFCRSLSLGVHHVREPWRRSLSCSLSASFSISFSVCLSLPLCVHHVVVESS